MSGATWISPTSYTMSSLETGNMVYVLAWGGSDYGYAYTFTLNGAPSGVTIDTDTGCINVASALGAGTYPFIVIATNRDGTGVGSFTFTLTVLQGVTFTSTIGAGAITASQIAHRTYDPASGTWGNPVGNDYSTVFSNMVNAILADQTTCNAVHDGSLRATIPLARTKEYDYTNNGFLTGIQYFQIKDTGSGALPIMKCTKANANADVDKGPLNIGWPGTALGNPAGGFKNHCATFATNNVGDTTITLLNAGDSSKIKPGRWHLICGQTIQIGGYPPNCMWVQYVQVTAVNGTTVTLDRPLNYKFQQDWYENLSDDQSLGVARIIPYDTGGTGGYTPTDPRASLRCGFTNVTFAQNPNYSNNLGGISQTQGHIDLTFTGCSLISPNPTQLKNILFSSCTLNASGEFDKLSEMIVLDNVTSGAFNGTEDWSSASSFMYVLYRGCHVTPIIMSTRQLRVLNSTIDALGDNFLQVPVSFQFNGAIIAWDFENSTVQGSSAAPHWVFAQNPQTGTGTTMGQVLGTDCSWGTGTPPATTLVFPSSTVSGSQFENAMVKVAPGMIISTGTGLTPITTNWGYITKVYSPGDGTAMWLDVTWQNGSKPTAGGTTLWFHRWHRLTWTNVTLGTAGGVTTTWLDPGFPATSASPNASYGPPTGLPSQYAFTDPNTYVDGSEFLMAGSQDPGISTVQGSPTFVDGSCTMMQSESLQATG